MQYIAIAAVFVLLLGLNQKPKAPPRLAPEPATSEQAQIVNELLGIVYDPGTWRPREHFDLRRLDSTVQAARKFIRDEGWAWTRVPVAHFSGNPIYTYSALKSVSLLGAEAATDRGMRDRFRKTQKEAVRAMLRDPRSREVYNHWINDDGRGTSDDGEWVLLHHLMGGDLPEARTGLKRDCKLAPGEWGALIGLHWIQGSDVKMLQDRVPFVSLRALAAGGVNLSANGPVVRVVNGKKSATIPIGTESQAAARKAFRNSPGVVYVPLYELNRLGLHTVQMFEDAQFVNVLPFSPSPTSEGKDPLTGKPVP